MDKPDRSRRLSRKTLRRNSCYGIYLHIPFCKRKCDYCHFYVTRKTLKLEALLFEGLHQEWQLIQPATSGMELASVYFGGGTPSLADPERIARILEHLSPPPGAEVTLEANPDDLSAERVWTYRQIGINRISLGVQTLDTPLLQQIGRVHDADAALSAIEAVNEGGIENLSVDLMFDLPGQTLDQMQATLNRITCLPITHLSLYNLAIEAPSAFACRREEIERQMPDERSSLAMLSAACSALEAAGLKRYEISAFARPGFEAVHNTGYWTGRPFLGMGPSAFSYWNRKRLRNVPNIEAYASALKGGKLATISIEQLSNEKRWRELFTIGLRLIEGVDLEQFTSRYGPSSVDLAPLLSQGLLRQNGTRIALTDKGRLFYDTVATELV